MCFHGKANPCDKVKSQYISGNLPPTATTAYFLLSLRLLFSLTHGSGAVLLF